ncbi:hypothetical protein PG990_013350 [Apiospora arundinis]
MSPFKGQIHPGSSARKVVNQPRMDPWFASSQLAADLYASGAKLWRRDDLRNIEKQLAQRRTLRNFTVRLFNGDFVSIPNPMFGVEKPIWKPTIVFREYWNLVSKKPVNRPAMLYNCTYLVDYENDALKDHNQGPIPEAQTSFEEVRSKWECSDACAAFKKLLQQLITGSGGETARNKKVTKVVCFALGEMARKAPDWWRYQNAQKPEAERQSETQFLSGAQIHHAIALTIASVVADSASTAPSDPKQEPQQPKEQERQKVRLLTQDPSYSDATRSILEKIGTFEIVGKYGAEGFAEVDDECIVFSPFAAAPVRQIVECFARPVAMIYADYRPDVVLLQPGTVKMMEEYEVSDFPTESDSAELKGGLDKLKIYSRVDGQSRLT